MRGGLPYGLGLRVPLVAQVRGLEIGSAGASFAAFSAAYLPERGLATLQYAAGETSISRLRFQRRLARPPRSSLRCGTRRGVSRFRFASVWAVADSRTR